MTNPIRSGRFKIEGTGAAQIRRIISGSSSEKAFFRVFNSSEKAITFEVEFAGGGSDGKETLVPGQSFDFIVAKDVNINVLATLTAGKFAEGIYEFLGSL